MITSSGILDDVERVPFEEQLQRQERLLADQLEYVRHSSRFFGPRLGTDPVRSFDELADVPFVRKQELRDAQAEDPPLGSLAAAPLERINRLHVTSGTTGTPLMIGFTAGDLERSTRVGSRAFWSAGLRPHHRVLHCLNYAFYVGGVADHISVEATGATVIPVGIGQSERLLDLFPVLRPDAMFAITSYSDHLADVARRRGLDPAELGLSTIITGGEAGGDIPEIRTRIERTWNARVGDTYGLGEVWPTVAAHCELRNGLHATAPECLVIELVDPSTERPLQWTPGATGELVYTHLAREATPLVRYRSGDLATVLSTTCECGRRTPRFGLVGRSDDMFVVRGVNVFPNAIETVLSAAVPTLRAFAVVINEPTPQPPIEVFFEADDDVGPERPERLIRERLQVQVEARQLPTGTIEAGEHKAKRLWRRYVGDDPPWLRSPGSRPRN